MRGGSVLPALTPRMPPQPIFSRSALPNTSTCRPRSRATSSAISAMRVGGQFLGRRVGQVAREHRGRGHRLAGLRARCFRFRALGGRHQRELLEGYAGLLALQLLVAVAREQHAFGDGLRGRRRRDTAGDIGEAGRQMRLPGCGARERGGRITQLGDIEAGIADADRNDDRLSCPLESPGSGPACPRSPRPRARRGRARSVAVPLPSIRRRRRRRWRSTAPSGQR